MGSAPAAPTATARTAQFSATNSVPEAPTEKSSASEFGFTKDAAPPSWPSWQPTLPVPATLRDALVPALGAGRLMSAARMRLLPESAM